MTGHLTTKWFDQKTDIVGITIGRYAPLPKQMIIQFPLFILSVSFFPHCTVEHTASLWECLFLVLRPVIGVVCYVYLVPYISYCQALAHLTSVQVLCRILFLCICLHQTYILSGLDKKLEKPRLALRFGFTTAVCVSMSRYRFGHVLNVKHTLHTIKCKFEPNIYVSCTQERTISGLGFFLGSDT